MISPHKPQQKNRTLIRGGRIVDGSGAPAYHSDLLIEGDIIREIQPISSAILSSQNRRRSVSSSTAWRKEMSIRHFSSPTRS